MQYFTRWAGTTLPNINVGQNDGINHAEAKKKKKEKKSNRHQKIR